MKLKTIIATCALCLILIGPCRTWAAPVDPCQSSNVEKLSVPIQAMNDTVQIIPSSVKSVHVCGFGAAPQGATVFLFESPPSSGAPPLTPLMGSMTAGG